MYYLMAAFSFRLQISIDKYRTNANNFFFKLISIVGFHQLNKFIEVWRFVNIHFREKRGVFNGKNRRNKRFKNL